MKTSNMSEDRSSEVAADEQGRQTETLDIDALGAYLVKRNRKVLDMLEEYDRRQSKSQRDKKK